ncbi:MAG: sulfite exporter TauE/SafE family protein [Alkalinema sp. CAN_BIN05]|nr:sulfite exporter TauE/SafE family protein [Alkalinema sp. CAN_BIN05]
MKKLFLRSFTLLFSFIIFLSIHLLTASSSQAHWADLASADITINLTSAQMLLTIPTGLVREADTDRNGKLSPTEIDSNQVLLQDLLGKKIQIINDRNQSGSLQISPATAIPNLLPSSSNDRSTIQLIYSWPAETSGVKIHYALFEPGIQTARCITTIAHNKTVKNIIFSPENQDAVSFPNSPLNSSSVWVTIVGAFLWGAAHAMSPGHGKTLVGAYLMGEKATVRHAFFLGLTTTVTHTLGVFILGGVTLLASRAFLPEQLFPWLSLLSGLLVVTIGGNLLRDRLNKQIYSDSHHHHSHNDSHSHTHNNDSPHQHHSHSTTHSHIPPEGNVNLKSLLALGVSGGLIPCPSALLLLLSSIALGQVGYGLILVLSFSLGLASVLTGLGLLLIYSKYLFIRFPIEKWTDQNSFKLKWIMNVIPIITASAITFIGLIISIQALWQIGMIKIS